MITNTRLSAHGYPLPDIKFPGRRKGIKVRESRDFPLKTKGFAISRESRELMLCINNIAVILQLAIVKFIITQLCSSFACHCPCNFSFQGYTPQCDLFEPYWTDSGICGVFNALPFAKAFKLSAAPNDMFGKVYGVGDVNKVCVPVLPALSRPITTEESTNYSCTHNSKWSRKDVIELNMLAIISVMNLNDLQTHIFFI
jgi:hypothetical protein